MSSLGYFQEIFLECYFWTTLSSVDTRNLINWKIKQTHKQQKNPSSCTLKEGKEETHLLCISLLWPSQIFTVWSLHILWEKAKVLNSSPLWLELDPTYYLFQKLCMEIFSAFAKNFKSIHSAMGKYMLFVDSTFHSWDDTRQGRRKGKSASKR